MDGLICVVLYQSTIPILAMIAGWAAIATAHARVIIEVSSHAPARTASWHALQPIARGDDPLSARLASRDRLKLKWDAFLARFRRTG
ncbi:MAG: hypothetical protein A3G80_14620 [Betaproteobacteria bacterium RIFCSPLOWO2_12_FULL_62_13b]|nr:MAG: hypothetical protein A3G80_14620 [Betaproteobacteria bacterium RIFCSPLOWO2_12_FULL_62_13b]